VLFGTAKITRQYPAQYGIEGMFYANWKEQLIWPLYKTPRKPKRVQTETVHTHAPPPASESQTMHHAVKGKA